jgi:putative solute:sodium symporter small subunit
MDPYGFICARLPNKATTQSIMPYVFLQWNKMRLEKGDIQRMAEFDNKNARRAQFSAQVRGLMLKLLVIWFVVSFGFGILMVEPLNEIRLGGYKLGFWFAQQGSIFVFIVLIFYFAAAMSRLEREYTEGSEQ